MILGLIEVFLLFVIGFALLGIGLYSLGKLLCMMFIEPIYFRTKKKLNPKNRKKKNEHIQSKKNNSHVKTTNPDEYR